MKWLKYLMFIFTYVVLLYTANGLLRNSYESITNMFGYIRAANEMNNVSSLIVEILTTAVVAILFFVPIGGGKGGRNSINLHYYIEHAYLAIEDFFENSELSNEVKKQKLITMSYNILIYGVILIAYIFLIRQIHGTENGLKVLLLLLFAYIVIQGVDFLTNIVEKIDTMENDVSNTSYLSKKNTITWVIIFGLYLFLYLGMPFINLIYSNINDLPLISIFDGNRINTNQ